MNQDTNVSYNASGEDISNKKKEARAAREQKFSLECLLYWVIP